MTTCFPKKEFHFPQWFIIDAKEKTLGRLATQVSKLLRGKELCYFTPGVDVGNFVIIINADKIKVSGKKEVEKLYYRNSQRPGNLKIETFNQLKNRIPVRILEKAIWGMLPKGVLGRRCIKRLYVYSQANVLFSKETLLNNTELQQTWIETKI